MSDDFFNLNHPGALRWLWALVPLGVLFALDVRRRERVLRLFVSRSLLEDVSPRRSVGRRVAKSGLLAASLATFALALAQPRWNPEQVEVQQQGQNLLFCLDVSNSMRARDVDPSRLGAAKAAVRELVRQLPAGNQVGLLAYAGSAELKCPLTPNYSHFLSVLEDVTFNDVDVGGTNLGDAISKATRDVFGLKTDDASKSDDAETPKAGRTVLSNEPTETEDSPNVMVILTDGETHEGYAREMAAEAHGLGVGIYIIGLGTEAGAPIPIEENGRTTTLKYKGEEVITKFEEGTLRKVVEDLPSRKGFLAAGSASVDLADVYNRVIAKQGKQTKELHFTVWEEKFQLFVGVGLALFIISTLMSEQRPARRPADRPQGLTEASAMPAVARTLVAVSVLGALTRTADAGNIRPLLLDAQSEFQQEHYDKALALYRQAEEESADDPFLLYNTGLCHLRLGDGDKAIEQFERAASSADAKPDLKQDALYNVGHLRATSAKGRFDALLAPATQPADQRAPDDPANIETLQGIADDLLRAIDALRSAREISTADDVEHNMQAARVLRRNVLGILRRAMEAKEKNDILDDPLAYLKVLTEEQRRQVALSRQLVLDPPKPLSAARTARRAAVRLQREIMERAGTLADQLGQFKETADDANSAGTQPAEPTPKERVYKAVADQVNAAVEQQRDACAHLLDGETEPAFEKQTAALEKLRVASFMFPREPEQVLVEARTEQTRLRELVNAVESPRQWLWDPALGQTTVPDTADLKPELTAIHNDQAHVGNLLTVLRMQCEQIASASQPADAPPQVQENPLLDPKLNAGLAAALADVQEVGTACIDAIKGKDKPATLAAQDRLLAIIDAALELLPKSIEQRIAALVVEQSRLNDDVEAAAPKKVDQAGDQNVSVWGRVRELAAELKAKVLRAGAAEVAASMRRRQDEIHTETVDVTREVKSNVPIGAAVPTPQAPSAGDNPQVQAYIEAGKHLDDADTAMRQALDGLDKAIVEKSLKPMEDGGTVLPAQTDALEALVKALMALRPPEQQPQQQQDQDQQKEQKQDQQQQDEFQDTRRAVERMERERERARQELYQQKPRTVIKDW